MKRLYIVRSVDLENVAFVDTVFTTKKEAMEHIRSVEKLEYYTDCLIRVDLYYYDGDVIGAIEESNAMQDDLSFIESAQIVWKR